MDAIKKHVDTVVILTGILTSILWMNVKFNNLEKDMAVIAKLLSGKDNWLP